MTWSFYYSLFVFQLRNSVRWHIKLVPLITLIVIVTEVFSYNAQAILIESDCAWKSLLILLNNAEVTCASFSLGAAGSALYFICGWDYTMVSDGLVFRADIAWGVGSRLVWIRWIEGVAAGFGLIHDVHFLESLWTGFVWWLALWSRFWS